MADATSQRLRAAWLYHNQGLTQAAVADRLGVSRATVIRMLEEARRRREVRVWVKDDVSECVELGLALEDAFGVSRAIVVPSADNPAVAVGAALGTYLSQTITSDMTVGVGWGRTLDAALSTFVPGALERVEVVSLLGGVIHPAQINPVEFSWRLAALMDAACYLFLSPVFVDSPGTKTALLEACGLDRVFELAGALDMAVVSCGDIGAGGSSLAQDLVPAGAYAELVAAGAVCDVMCNFLDVRGSTVAHGIAARTMSVDLDTVASAKNVVLATGGADRVVALRAALMRLDANTLITDEAAALGLLAR